MENITITLASKDVSVLDVALGKTLTLFPTDTATVKILSAITGPDGTLHRRNITVTNFSREQAEVLKKLDLPDNVAAQIRVDS